MWGGEEEPGTSVWAASESGSAGNKAQKGQRHECGYCTMKYDEAEHSCLVLRVVPHCNGLHTTPHHEVQNEAEDGRFYQRDRHLDQCDGQALRIGGYEQVVAVLVPDPEWQEKGGGRGI